MLCTRPHARAGERSLTAEARLALRRRVAWPSIPRHAHQFCLGFATKSFQSLHAGHVQKGALVLRNSGGARGDEQERERTSQHREPHQPRARVRGPDSHSHTRRRMHNK